MNYDKKASTVVQLWTNNKQNKIVDDKNTVYAQSDSSFLNGSSNRYSLFSPFSFGKLIVIVMIIFSLFILQISVISVQTTASATTFSYAVMDLETGRVVLSKNENSKQSIASLTKIVTAITVLENAETLDIKYYVPKSATIVPGSSIYLKEGETISIRELLYGLMLRSGNDSAAMLMQIIGGGSAGFSKLMNDTAKNVDANNSSFMNPHGLDSKDHYSTAIDMCKITKHAMENDVFSDIVSAKTYKGDRTIYQNKNKMLWNYPGANGVKTGYTSNSGRCLVTTATRDDKAYVCVVLNCQDMWNVSRDLLDLAFAK